MTGVLVAICAFVLMEPMSYLSHRFVMHGAGMVLHRSHHVPTPGRFEANDLFPVGFAGLTMMAMAAGATLPSLRVLLAVGVGVTLYGAAYLFVHDLYIHARLGRLPRIGFCEYLKASHRIHHLYGGEPFGMLAPVVPRRLRQRAAANPTDPFLALHPGAAGNHKVRA